MAPFKMFRTVPGLVPSVPLGAVATVGRRSDRGFPVDKDRFFIMSPNLVKRTYPKKKGGEFQCEVRELHPDYSSWNTRAAAGRYLRRKESGVILRDLAVMRGFVAFASIDEAFEAKRWAPELVGSGLRISPPGRLPACTGNGEEASRFVRMNGERPVYDAIECSEDCPFWGNGCKLKAALTFLPSWESDKMPRDVMRWTTSSQQSAENALGMLSMARRIGVGMGIPEPSLLGLPFEMKISEHTSSMIEPRRFPIVSFKVTTDIPEWFRAQKQQQLELGSGGYVMPVLKTPDEYVAEVLELEAGDEATLSAGPDEDPLLEAVPDRAEDLPMPEDVELVD